MGRLRQLFARLDGARIADADGRRVLAGRVGGALWLFAACATPLLAVVPEVDVEWPELVTAAIVTAAIWGVLAAFVLDWRRLPDLVVTVATLLAGAYAGMVIAATGGANSPARVYTLLVLVYAAGFLGPRAAAVAIPALAVVHSLPPSTSTASPAASPRSSSSRRSSCSSAACSSAAAGCSRGARSPIR